MMATRAKSGATVDKLSGNRDGARPAPSILRWVILSVVGCFLGQFLMSVGLMLTVAVELGQSKFVDLAREKYMGFLAWKSLALLVKGYGLLSVVYILVCYPLVFLWVKKRVKRVTRWAVIWRTVLLVMASVMLMIMRLFWKQPYFSSEGWIVEPAMDFLTSLPEVVTLAIFGFLFDVLPWVIAIMMVCFYAVAFRRSTSGLALRSRRIVYSMMGVAVAGVAVMFLWPQGGFGGSAKKRGEGASRPMNVLIIASDSLRGDKLSSNGYYREVSPNIDALAAKSTNFTKCFTPIGSTLESMTGMMTSRYPHSHGFRQMFPSKELVERVNTESATLAWTLRQEGYDTAVMGDWCAAIYNLTPMGFEDVKVSDYDNFKVWLSQAVYMQHFVIPLFFDNEVGYRLFPELESFAFFLEPEVVTDRVVKKLDEQSRRGDPFFWTVFYSCNHLNYHSPDPYYKKWSDPDYDGPHKYSVALDPDDFVKNPDIGKEFSGMDEADVEQIRALYDGCTSQFDDCVGRILEKLEETGQLENTIIIITSDHGDDLFEPGVSFCHGVSFSGGDQGNHIPGVMYVPGLEEKAKKVDKIVRNIDFAPTILDLLGLPVEPKFEGVSLVPYVKGGSDDLGLAYFGETSYLFFKRQIPGEVPLEIPAMADTTRIDEDFDHHIVLSDKFYDAVVKTKERCLRTEDFKLVYTPGQDHPIHRLYDLKSDPHCQRDVKVENPEVYAAMKKHLWAWIAEKKEARIPEIEGDRGVEEIEVPREFLEIDWGE